MNSSLLDIIIVYPFVCGFIYNIALFLHLLIERNQVVRMNPSLYVIYHGLLKKDLLFNNLPWLAMAVGLLSSQVANITYYLRPQDQNYFVLAFYFFLLINKLYSSRTVFGISTVTMRREDNPPRKKMKLIKLLLLAGCIYYFILLDLPLNKGITEYLLIVVTDLLSTLKMILS